MPKQVSNILSRGRNRRALDPSIPAQPVSPTAEFVGSDGALVTLDFNVPVTLRGVPQVLSTGPNGGIPVGAALASPTRIVLQYADSQDSATSYTWPQGDPAVRSYTGGAVAPMSLVF